MTLISYCITCKGRVEFMKQTLPYNIEVEKGNANIEFLVLDYDCPDGLQQWLFSNFRHEIAAGRITYERYAPAPYFRMAHAKNLAHFAAKGKILCSLDADNLLVKGFSNWLLLQYERNANFIASPRRRYFLGYIWQRWISKRLGRRTYESGLGGRIALAKSSFLLLGGYNEKMSAWGGDDLEFMLKARDNNLKWVKIPKKLWGSAIEHSQESRTMNMSSSDVAKSQKRQARPVVNQIFETWRAYSKTDRGIPRQ